MKQLKHLEDIEEINRLKTLLSYNILDTPYESEFDGLAELISIICETPIAAISMLDDKRQWFKAKVGIDGNEVAVGDTICQHTIVQDDILEIQDTHLDERVKQNPLVNANNGVRFYAGVPIKANNGYNIGTVCVVDNKPRTLTAEQKKALRLLTDQILVLLESRKKNKILGLELETVLHKRIQDTQNKLLRKETQYNNLLKAIRKSNGVVEFSPEGIILNVNQKFLDTLGYSNEEELIGKHHSTLVDREIQQKNREFWQLLKEGKYKAGRHKRLHKNGTPVWIQATYNPILDLQNNVVKIIKISQDITAEINASKEMEKAKDLAENLNTQKDYFIANVSHEIRTPIHAILGFTELLLEQEKVSTKLSYLQSVKTAGDNLLFIINDILDLSKIEAGVIQMESEPFHLRTIVNNVFSILHLKVHQKKIQLNLHIDEEVPIHLEGDKNRLTQILINLIGNAIKFTYKGGVELFIKAIKIDTGKALLEFEVRDTGIGIPKDKLAMIFERFSQAEDFKTTRKYGGTGLGLNISKHLVEKQNGSIQVKSIEGEGSSFIFTIPYKIVEDFEIHNTNNSPIIRYKERPGKILLCEDNELNQRLIKAILKERGYHIDLAENGNKGIELFKSRSYDLVLMDIQMPEKDGYQTTGTIREQFQSKVPIIALTANFLMVEKEKCLKLGMNDYLSKPFTKEELIAKINLWLNIDHEVLSKESKSHSTEISDNLVSLEILEEMTAGDLQFQREMILLFIEQTHIMIKDIENATSHQDLNQISSIAHTLKTSFGIIGANTKYLEILENAPAISMKNIELQRIVAQLGDQISGIISTLKNKLKESPTHENFTG